jgi:anti-sigma B factor antagonist
MEDLGIKTLAAQNDTQIFELTGPFTICTMFDFQSLVREQKAPVTLIDLSGVPYMDSAALGCLLGFHVSCQREGRKYGLVGASDRLKTLFKVAGVDGILLHYDSLEMAQAAGA